MCAHTYSQYIHTYTSNTHRQTRTLTYTHRHTRTQILTYKHAEGYLDRTYMVIKSFFILLTTSYIIMYKKYLHSYRLTLLSLSTPLSRSAALLQSSVIYSYLLTAIDIKQQVLSKLSRMECGLLGLSDTVSRSISNYEG